MAKLIIHVLPSLFSAVCSPPSGGAWLMVVTSAQAILFYDTADSSHNTNAPTGIYQNSGWQYQGIFGDNLGTAIGQNFFITAAHVSVESTFAANKPIHRCSRHDL